MGGTAWRRIFRVAAGAAALAVMSAAAGQTAGTGANPAETCVDGGAALNVGFYAFFAPVSHSAESDPASPGFGIHEGYEAALLTALEAIPGAGLKFSRAPIAEWDGIWLRPAAADGSTGAAPGRLPPRPSRQPLASQALNRSFISSPWSAHHSMLFGSMVFELAGAVGMCGPISIPRSACLPTSGAEDIRAGP